MGPAPVPPPHLPHLQRPLRLREERLSARMDHADGCRLADVEVDDLPVDPILAHEWTSSAVM
jgi:hypothetical protein